MEIECHIDIADVLLDVGHNVFVSVTSLDPAKEI